MDRRSPATRVTEGQLRAAASDPRTPRPDTLQVSLAQECNRIANRIQKVLEDANIKLASVATDALGASGRQMIQAIIGGQQDSAVLAEMSKGLPRNKIPDLKLALEGRVSEHHRFLLKEMLDDLRHVNRR